MNSTTNRLLCILLTLGVTGACPALPQPAAPMDVPPISVSLLVPDQHHGDRLDRLATGSHVDVVLQNVSDRPQAVWAEWCSWGWYNVFLEVTALNGKPLTRPLLLARGPRAWAANFPDLVSLSPGQQIVRELPFRELLPVAAREQLRGTVTLQAVYDGAAGNFRIAAQDSVEDKFGVWAGRSVSPPVEVTVG